MTGDYGAIIPNFKNNDCFIAIGDVTGHGISAGLIMLMVQSSFLTLDKKINSLKEIMNKINRVVYLNTIKMKIPRDLSLSILYYNNDKIKLTGEHETVLILRKNSHEIEEINTSNFGVRIGLVEDIAEHLQEIEIQVSQGDIICLYTDGITEAENDSGNLFSIDLLKKTIIKHRDKDSLEINDSIIRELEQFMGNTKPYDDITLLTFKIK